MISRPDASASDLPDRRPWSTSDVAWFTLLLITTTCLVFSGLSGGARFEGTDCWVAQTAREMRESGNWVVPRFSGETRLQKSPGAYWAVMLVSELRGTPVDEVSTRIPNAVAAVVIVVVIFWLARRIAGSRAAVFAGFAAASSQMILYWSHRGASDLGLAACITLSLGSLWVASGDEPPGWRRNLLWLIGYVAAGAGMLYKMPMPLVCIGLPAVAYVVIQRKWRIFASPWHVLGLILFCAIWVPWAVMVVRSEPTALAKWKVEFFDRFTGDLPNIESQKRWYFYFFYLIPLLAYTLPYSLSIPAAVWRAFRPQEGVHRDSICFMLIWFFSHLAFFTISSGKESRYFLPALPPLFVLLGCELSAFFDNQRPVSARMSRIAFLAIVGAVIGAGIGGGYGLRRWQEHNQMVSWSEVWQPVAILGLILGAGIILAAALHWRGARNASFAALVLTMWAGWLWGWPNVAPVFAAEKHTLDFAYQLRDRLPHEMRSRLFNVGHQNPGTIWYSNVRFPRVIEQLELLRRQGGKRSLNRERMIIGEEMVAKLSGSEPVLFVADRGDYVMFLLEASRHLAAQGRTLPKTHLWIQTRIGGKERQSVIFGNTPPPWPEEPLTPPSAALLAG